MQVFKIIGNNLAPLTLLGALFAYLLPEMFLVFKHVFLWMFAATMFSLGVVVNPEEFKEVRSEGKNIFFGLLTQYSVMPLLGAAAAYLSGLPNEVALGLIIVACAPGAMASNVVVYLAGGALAYSIVLTTVATFISPVLTPSLVKWLGGELLPIPFWPMMQTILLTVVLPLILGMLTRRFLKTGVTQLIEIAPAIAVLAIVIICSYAVAANHDRIASMGMQLFVIVALINASGYLFGWYLAKLYGFDKRHQVALTIEIGMQNAGLGVALALKHFSPATALPGAIFAVWCILTAAGMTAYLRKLRTNQERLATTPVFQFL
ncbi:MAG: bile acid:sodium symporter family protein [Gammaproteobacteria bacterium]|nr:bile acid:sodium symporter family protein [Gammaproteobacteria bacterium]